MSLSLRFERAGDFEPDPAFAVRREQMLASLKPLTEAPTQTLRAFTEWAAETQSRVQKMTDEAAAIDPASVSEDQLSALRRIVLDGEVVSTALGDVVRDWNENEALFVRHQEAVQRQMTEVEESLQSIVSEAAFVAYAQQLRGLDRDVLHAEMYGEDAGALMALDERIRAAVAKFKGDTLFSLNSAAEDLGLEHRVWFDDAEIEAMARGFTRVD